MQEATRIDLRCPECGEGALTAHVGGPGPVVCGGCSARYEVRDGIVDLLPELAPERSFAQVMMEWRPLIRIYESRFWRRSAVFEAVAGLSFEEELRTLQSAERVEEGSRVLDLACGTGIYARPFARAVGSGLVIGLDLSLPMLEYGAGLARDAGLSNLLLLRASALDLPLEDASVDVVNCCGALHLFPDLERVLAEVGRVLRPGGRFGVAVFRRGPSARAARFAERRKRWLGVDAYRPDELAARLEASGFCNAVCHHEGRSWAILTAEKP